ncbi:isochorismatase family protein [Streptomyces sp. VRA16 Mangrove soil]|uniref:isochorismatase family protein n=1 Tax=Streptomyces sp. VRA16 Mangrove soil TaxID=2817434 RepID=UPI001A9E8F0A|nr:isochorismatase family protein [Streptomyces sp. VRA16 Mangrove soil]MBO1336934.1 isochorismatase family protein [Streptomyces sp. VRA16 Mangrove soil]
MDHRPALLVVDMHAALLPIMHRPGETVAVIAGLRQRARAAGVPVVTVGQLGGGPVVAELAPEPRESGVVPGEVRVEKTTADAFLRTDLDTTLRGLGVTEVLVTGFATENCVETTARQALSHGYDLVLVADGHTTSLRPDTTDFVPPAQAIAHHNEIYRHIDFPERRVRVLPAQEIDF